MREPATTTPSATISTLRRFTFLLPLALALSLLGSAASAQELGQKEQPGSPNEHPALLSPDEAPLSYAQPQSPTPANPNPLGQIEQAAPPMAPQVAISCNGAGGPWNTPGTWSPSGVPTAADSVTITSGCTVTIDTAAVALSVVVQTGGILEFDSVAAQSLTAAQSVTIDAGGTFRTPAVGVITAHVLSVGTDLVNNGTLDFSTNANTAGAGITFTGAGNNSFSGTGATTNIRTLTINKGTSFANTLEITTSNFTVQGATTDGAPMAFLTLTNGTLKISGTFTMDGRVFNAVSYTIPATGGIWLNNPNFTVSGQAASNPTNNGLFRLSSGIYNVGTLTGNSMGAGIGASFVIEGGTLNVAGRLNSGSTFITYTQSAGTVNISTVGNATATASFGFTGTTGVVTNFSGGTINLVQAGTSLDYNETGTMNFTGGTLNVGTAATAVAFTFRIQGQMPAVVIDNTTNNKTANLSAQGNVWGNLTINPGTTMNLNGQTLLMIGPTITNNGAIVVTVNNGSSVNFAGGLQQAVAPYAQTYAGTGTFGAALLRVASFALQNPLGVTITPGVSALNIYRINAFYGPITNSNNLAIGNADAVALIIQRGATGIPFPAGSLDVSPTFSIGAGGLTLVYAQSATLETTGPEIPATRTVLGIQILNPTGVTLTGGALTATNTASGLLLGGGTLNTSAANLLTLTGTTTGALSGGSAITYVNGPLARTLPASLVSGSTYTFPVGKGSFKMLELVNPTTNAGGTVVIQTEVFDANSGGSAGTGFSSINTDRYWNASMTAGAANFINATVRLTEQGTPGINAIGQSATQGGAYDSIGGTVTPPTIGPSAVVTTLDFFVVGTLTGSTTMCGNFNVFAAAVVPDFPTLTAAVAALNTRLMTCAVTFTLTDPVYAAETYPIIIQPNGGASATNTLTIKPGPGVFPSFTGTAATALIVLNGADYVTIDGSNTVAGTTRDMSLKSTSASTTSGVIWGQTIGTADPVTNNTIKNLNLAGNTSTTTLVGVGFGSATISAATAGTHNDNNRIQNNAITSAQFGVISQGNSSALKNFGTVITGNTLGGAGALALGRVGIYVGFDDGVQITNNTINGVSGTVTSVDTFGIALGSISISNSAFTTNNDVANVVVTGNIIGPVLKGDTFSVAGISMGTNNYGTSRIANNSIWGVLGNGTSGDFCVGIYVGNAGTAYSTTQIYYNSVSIVGNRDTGGASSQPAFALAILGSNPLVDIRDNALYNISTAAAGGPGGVAGSYAIGFSSTAPMGNIISNYNDLFTSGASSHFAMSTSLVNILGDRPTLAAWQAATGKDASSIAVDPTFNSTTNLQPLLGSPLLGAGTPVAVTIDILGVSRSVTTPTIGAYELAADTAGPVITYIALGNTTSTANRVLAVTATDISGVPTAGIGLPVLYLRKGLVGAYSASQCVSTGGSGYNCTLDYSLVGGVVTGDTIQYYVAAQDGAPTPNVSVNPAAGAAGFTANPPAAATPPTPPNSYLIATAVTGTKTVCASGCDFTTLTGATGIFNAINSGVATGNIVVEIGGDLIVGEDGSVGLNPLTEEPAGSNFTVKIYPTGVARAITSTVAPTGGFIRLNAADRVTIDGSIGGTGTDRSLTITDTNTGIASAVIWLQSNGADGATNNVVRNVNLVGTTVTATAGTLFGVGSGGSTISVGSFGSGNINNTYQNNDIRKTQIGIYSGGAGAGNKNTGTVITQNVMNAPSPNNVTTGGVLVNFENGVQITQNDIGNLIKHDGTVGTTTTVFGIALGVVPSNTVLVFTGNDVVNAVVTRNKIDTLTQLNSTGYSALGIVVNSVTSGTTLVANNMISQLRAASTANDFSGGIVAGGGTGSTTQIYANSVSMTGGRNAASYPSYGLAINSGDPIVDVRDNIFYNTQTTSSTGKMYAIANASTTFTNMTSNHNVLFVPAGVAFFVGQTGGLGTVGTDRVTLTDWQTATGQDIVGSLSADPLFVSAADVHLLGTSPARDAGTPLGAVTVDFDNDPRDPVTPDIGADEVHLADVSVTKSDGASTAVPGTAVVYTIVASNAGPFAAPAVTVTDNFPVALTGCSTTCVGGGGGSCTPGPIVGNLSDTANLPVGGSATYTAACSIAADATGTLANTATVALTGALGDPNLADNTATDSDTLTPTADLAITKTDGVGTVTPGGTTTYTITASNPGPSNAPGSTVVDNFAAVLSCSTTCVGSLGGTCTAGPILTDINDLVNLPVGGSVTYTSVCSIDGGASGSLVNTATVTPAGGVSDPTPGNNSATDTDAYAPTADLAITKTDGVTVVSPGTNTTYTIVASNSGPSAAPTAAVVDIFPAACTSVNWTCAGSGGGTCTASGSGNINQSANLPSGGSVTFTAVCAISVSATGTLSNTATIGVGVNDPNTANNSATDVDSLSNVIFIDGFESGDTSQWSVVVPFTLTVYNSLPIVPEASSTAFDYDFAALQSGAELAPSSIAFVADASGRPLFLIAARRTGAEAPLEWTLEVVGSGRSSWVEVAEIGQQVRIEWSGADQSNVGHVAVWLDGRLALWVDGFAPTTAPAAVKMLRGPASAPGTE